MPQIDKISYFSQLTSIICVFLVFYCVVVNRILGSIVFGFKTRSGVLLYLRQVYNQFFVEKQAVIVGLEGLKSLALIDNRTLLINMNS